MVSCSAIGCTNRSSNKEMLPASLAQLCSIKTKDIIHYIFN